MELPHGKIPIDILREIVFNNLGAKRNEVKIGPSAGIDGAIIDLNNKSLIVSMDPITGAKDRIGWLAVNINANDVSTFGVQPAFLLSCIMLAEKSNATIVRKICTQMDKAAKELGIAIVGGHCEVTPNLLDPIVVCCVMGFAEKGNYVTAAGAKQGDSIILTKSAGIEGTAILASDKEEQLNKTMNDSALESARKFYDKISVTKDALTAFRTGGVDAMHDPTEGGIAGGIHEMADASKLGVEIIEDQIKVEPETSAICKNFKIDPLQLISSGALLISAKPDSAERIVRELKRKRMEASVIGKFKEKEQCRKMITRKGQTIDLPRPVSDHLWLALKQQNSLLNG